MTAADKIKALPLPEPRSAKAFASNTPVYAAYEVRALLDAAAAIAARQDEVRAQMVRALTKARYALNMLGDAPDLYVAPSVWKKADAAEAEELIAAALRAHKEMT